jgi:aerobic-type carbon monoxide dehydrogenase small subunit (CoxS/CutS family)
MTEIIKFELNGKPAEILPDGEKTLLTVLRTRFGLTGTKYGCRIGFCGSCTVIVDGEPMRSCITPVEDIAGKKVITIEGLSENGTLHPLQNAFIKHDALQCGYCTPGMILNAYGLLIKNPEPTRQEIIEHMEGNLCRCGSYGRIIEAIQTAASEMKGGVK